MLSFLAVSLFVHWGVAQRPSNVTICDYYAVQKYQANTTETQHRLMQGIIALAFGGGAEVPNATDVTGVFNPGVFQGVPVNLSNFFDGSKASTNLNNQPVGINWLDGGGRVPLNKFLTGSTNEIVITNTTNQYRLFSHWTFAFSKLFGCTKAKPLPPGGAFLSLAYVHKFMDLNYTEVGHFIEQLTKSSGHFGFSDQDRLTLNTQMNAQYNVRCAPPVTTNPQLGPQLYSLCQNATCPLAQPVPDCSLYTDLSPSGVGKSGTSTGTPTPFPSSPTAAPSSTASPTPSTSPTITQAPASSPSISTAGIIGSSIGGAALVFGFIALIIFLLRKRRTEPKEVYPPTTVSNPSYYTPSHPDNHMSYMSGNTSQTAQVERWVSEAPDLPRVPPVEMEGGDSGGGFGSPKMTDARGSMGAGWGQRRDEI